MLEVEIVTLRLNKGFLLDRSIIRTEYVKWKGRGQNGK